MPPVILQDYIEEVAKREGLTPDLLRAVIDRESAFDPCAVSVKGAQGLMQLIPGTARRFGVEDAWDPVQNLQGGMAYLRWLLNFFDGNEALALAYSNNPRLLAQRASLRATDEQFP